MDIEYSLTLFPEPPSCFIQTPEALKNEDILGLIFQHFDLQPGSHTVAQTRKDLLSAAQTCKAFVEPALDSLWRVLPSLLPLLMLLPSAEVNSGHYVSFISSYQYSIHSLLASIFFLITKFVDELPLDDDSNRHQFSGWGRFDVHARRVRTIYMVPLRIAISPNIYLRIRAMRDSPLLPGLKNIFIPNNSSIDLSSALFLASGSTLNMVELDGNATADRQFFVPFLSSLYIKSPGLSHLAIRGDVLSGSLESISRFTKLQSLEIRLFNAPHTQLQVLRKLGQLPHLLDLTIDTGTTATSSRPYTNSTSIDNPKFRRLRHLQILGTTASISCILDELKGLTNLTALKINKIWDGRMGSSVESAWNSSFEVISTFSAVEDIEITLDLNRGQNSHMACSFAPLFKLENMKSFVTNFDMAPPGFDDNFPLLAHSFPKLKKLVVSRAPSFSGRTLACLFYLSLECPDLREIKIALSSDISYNLNAIKNLPVYRNHHHPLEKLHIDSNFGQLLQPIQLVRVARFLDHMFPNLSTLETDNSKTTEAANWMGIHELRLALRDARINSSPVGGF